MPIVRLEVRRGVFAAGEKKALLSAVHDAVVATFKTPDHDRTQRILEIDGDDFEIPPGHSERFVIVEVSAFAGRSLDVKRALYRDVVARFAGLGVAGDDVIVLVHDVAKENWGMRGGQAACDIQFGTPTR